MNVFHSSSIETNKGASMDMADSRKKYNTVTRRHSMDSNTVSQKFDESPSSRTYFSDYSYSEEGYQDFLQYSSEDEEFVKSVSSSGDEKTGRSSSNGKFNKSEGKLHVNFPKSTRRQSIERYPNISFLGKFLSVIGGQQGVEGRRAAYAKSGSQFRTSAMLDEQNPPTFEEYRSMEKCLIETKIDLAVVQEELERQKEQMKNTKMELEFLREQHKALKSQHLNA